MEGNYSVTPAHCYHSGCALSPVRRASNQKSPLPPLPNELKVNLLIFARNLSGSFIGESPMSTTASPAKEALVFTTFVLFFCNWNMHEKQDHGVFVYLAFSS